MENDLFLGIYIITREQTSCVVKLLTCKTFLIYILADVVMFACVSDNVQLSRYRFGLILDRFVLQMIVGTCLLLIACMSIMLGCNSACTFT